MVRLLVRLFVCLALACPFAALQAFVDVAPPPVGGRCRTPAERYLEWAAITAVFGSGLFGISLVAGRAFRSLRKKPAGCCAHCGYDLCGLAHAPCPECGRCAGETCGFPCNPFPSGGLRARRHGPVNG